MARSIGLDVGHHAVRAVACERTRAGWSVVGHASVPRQDSSGIPRPLAAVLSELDSRLRLTRAQVTVADSARNVLIRYIPTVPMQPERLAKLLRLELAQHTNDGVELAADIYEVPLAGEEVIHGAVMAQPDQIRDLLTDLKVAGIVPTRIHVGAAALANPSLVVTSIVNEDEIALMVDIGAATTRVSLVGNGRLFAFRQLALGGDAFTQALAEQRSLDPAQAEQIKLRWNVGHALASVAASGADTADTVSEEGDDLVFAPKISRRKTTDSEEIIIADEGYDLRIQDSPEAPVAAVKPESNTIELLDDDIPTMPVTTASGGLFIDVEQPAPGHRTVQMSVAALGPEMTRAAENLFTQLMSTIAWFKAQLQSSKISPTKIVVCGGGSALSGLESYLSRRFKLPVETYAPFEGLTGDIPAAAHEYTLALGLALSDDPHGVRLDLLPERNQRKKVWRDQLIWPYVAAATLAAASILFGITILNDQWDNEQSLANLASYRTQKEALDADLAALTKDQEALSDDLRTIAGRVYFNRDLLYVIRGLKELAPQKESLWLTRLETIPPQVDIKPATTGTRRISTSASSKSATLVDNSIDRGAIELEGRVKFQPEDDMPPDKLNAFFMDYMQSVDAIVAGDGGAPLFDAKETRVFLHWLHDDSASTSASKVVRPKNSKQPAPAADGSYPFGVRFVLRPTDLSQATERVVEGDR